MTQYFADVLQKPTSGLDVPDLQAMAKDNNVSAALTMCRLTIAIAVQCEKNKETIEKIQGLSETNQHYLKMAIEVVRNNSAFLDNLMMEKFRSWPKSRQHKATAVSLKPP
jgi:hypothetical protein